MASITSDCGQHTAHIKTGSYITDLLRESRLFHSYTYERLARENTTAADPSSYERVSSNSGGAPEVGRDIFRLECDADFLIEYGGDIVRKTKSSGDAWGGGHVGEWDKRRYTPDREAAQDAERIFHEVDAAINLDTLKGQHVAGPVGSTPLVGNFLAGNPNSMARYVSLADESGPVRVFCDLTVSGGVDRGTMRARAIATLALARAIQQVRPVELWAVCSTAPANDRNYTFVADTCIMARVGLAP
ncbi:MAG: hypothetical protein HRU13_11455, partial [Phycisphaerales bacterium]|nr:hypothetical protein [Phycisphaerales bacterium]